MKPFIRMFPACLMCALLACQLPSKPSNKMFAELAGVVVGPPVPLPNKRPTGGKYFLADLDNVEVDQKAQTKTLQKGTVLETKNTATTGHYPWIKIQEEIKIQNKAKFAKYELVFGAQGPNQSAYGQVRNSYYSGNGWTFYWGEYAVPHTTIVCAAATGTTFITQYLPDSKERVIVLDGTVAVACDPPPTGCQHPPTGETPVYVSATGSVKGRYVEIDPPTPPDDCDIGAVTDVPNTPGNEVYDFLVEATAAACAAGWTGPRWACPSGP